MDSSTAWLPRLPGLRRLPPLDDCPLAAPLLTLLSCLIVLRAPLALLRAPPPQEFDVELLLAVVLLVAAVLASYAISRARIIYVQVLHFFFSYFFFFPWDGDRETGYKVKSRPT